MIPRRQPLSKCGLIKLHLKCKAGKAKLRKEEKRNAYLWLENVKNANGRKNELFY